MAVEVYQTKNGTDGVEIIDFTKGKNAVSRQDVAVEFSQDFNRKSSHWIGSTIDTIWEEKCRGNCRLYNRSKFRFHSATRTPLDGRDPAVMVKIGLTSYKDLMGTNCHPFGRELTAYGAETFGCIRSCLSDALGVGSLLLTKDDNFLFMKRALWTGEDQGKLDRPGGHPEPDNISEPTQNFSLLGEATNNRVRDEIFDSVLHELRDEINLPMEVLQDPLLLGVVRSIERLGRPSAEFLVRCALTSKEINALYCQSTQAEADESVGIVYASERDVRDKTLDNAVWSNLTDAACGAIELYHRYYGCEE